MRLANAELAVNIAARGSARRLRQGCAAGEHVKAKLESSGVVVARRARRKRKAGKCNQESVQNDRIRCDQRDNSAAKARASHSHLRWRRGRKAKRAALMRGQWSAISLAIVRVSLSRQRFLWNRVIITAQMNAAHCATRPSVCGPLQMPRSPALAPQLDQVPPLTASPVDSGRRCNRRSRPLVEFCDSLCPARGNDLTRKGLRDV